MNSTTEKPKASDALTTAYLIISIINFAFVVFGTVGNLFTFFILMRKNLRTVYSYTRYLSALCIIDILCLYNWNFTFIYQDILSSDKKRIEYYTPLSCRIFSFIAYSSLQLSSWIMCVIGIDRIILLVSMKKNKPANSIENKKNIFDWLKKINPFQSSLLVVILLTVIIFSVNLVVLIKNAEPYVNHKANSSNQTSTRTFTCYAPEAFFKIWDIFHVLMYSVIPFCIILTQNCLIAVLTLKHSRRMRRYEKPQTSSTVTATGTMKSKFSEMFTSKKSSVDATTRNKSVKQQSQSKGTYVKNLLIFLTVSFFFTTLPYSMIYTTTLNETYFKYHYGSIVKRCLVSLQYTRHATNFLIYILTSSIIQKEIKKFFEEVKFYLFKRN